MLENNILVNQKLILAKIIYHHKREPMVNQIVIFLAKVVLKF